MIDQAIVLYEQIIQENLDPVTTKISKNFLQKHKAQTSDLKLLQSVRSYEEGIAIAISLRRTRGASSIAIEILKKAYDYATAISQKVKIAAELRKNKEIDYAKKILENIKNKSFSNDSAVDITMAASLRKEKSLEEASILYHKVLEREPKNRVALVGLAAVLKDLKDFNEALNVLKKYPPEGYKNPYFLKVLYSLSLKINDYKYAQKTYNILLKYYDKFEPLKFINQLIKNYQITGYKEGLQRMYEAKEILENQN